MGSLSPSYILRILSLTSTMAQKRENIFVLKILYVWKLGLTLIVWKCKSWEKGKKWSMQRDSGKDTNQKVFVVEKSYF